MGRISKQVKASYPNNVASPLVEVNYYKADELLIIINEKNEILEVSECNVPALIAMLQSVCGRIKTV